MLILRTVFAICHCSGADNRTRTTMHECPAGAAVLFMIGSRFRVLMFVVCMMGWVRRLLLFRRRKGGMRRRKLPAFPLVANPELGFAFCSLCWLAGVGLLPCQVDRAKGGPCQHLHHRIWYAFSLFAAVFPVRLALVKRYFRQQALIACLVHTLVYS